MRLGGSTKGTTLAYGDFGLRLTEGTRLSAKQLQTSFDAIKKAIKPVKGAQTCVSPSVVLVLSTQCPGKADLGLCGPWTQLHADISRCSGVHQGQRDSYG